MQPQQPDQSTQPTAPEPASNDQWQQPEQPTTTEPHAYAAPDTVPQSPEQLDPQVTAQSDAPEQPQPPRDGEDYAVRWQAAEHIDRDQDALWFVWFGVITLAFMALAIFLMKSWTFAVLVPVMAAALIVYVRRPPAVHDYTLSRQGLHINDKLYSFGEFKEFGLVSDDDEHSVMLVPRKRLRPGVTVYFPEEVGEQVVDMLAARLPMHQIKLDPIDRLIRLLRI